MRETESDVTTMIRPNVRSGAAQRSNRKTRHSVRPWPRYATVPWALPRLGAKTSSHLLERYGAAAALLGAAWWWSRSSTVTPLRAPKMGFVRSKARLAPIDLPQMKDLSVWISQGKRRDALARFSALHEPDEQASNTGPGKKGSGRMSLCQHAPYRSKLARFVREALKRAIRGTRLEERRLIAAEVSAEQKIGRGRGFMLIYATALGATAVAFITLALLVRGDQLTQLDIALTRRVQAVHEPIFSWTLTHASDLGWFPANAVCFGLIFLALFQLGLRLEAALAVTSSLLAGFAGEGVKVWIGRMRPSAPAVHVAAHLSGYSFPSGHVIQYVTLFGFASYAISAAWNRGLARNATLVLFAALIALVGPSRVYLGQHWPSDVVGAYLFAALWLAGTIEVHLLLKRRGVWLLRQHAL